MPQIDWPELDLFSLVMPAAGVYLLWVAAFGKAKLLQNAYPKCSPKKYRFWMRILSAVSGVLLIVKGALEIFGVAEPGTFLSGFLWVLGLISLLGLMAFSIVMTDRQKAREAAEEEARASGRATGRQNGSRMPEGAFSFGDEDASAEDEETKKE